MNGHQPGVASCPNCSSRVFVDDLQCVSCDAQLVYEPDLGGFVLLAEPCRWRADRRCNWSAARAGVCRACRRIETEPHAALREDLVAVYAGAIRRVLRRVHDGFGLDLETVVPALAFSLDLSSVEHPVTIGHNRGIVTLDVADADPVHLETQRLSLGEPYRTPLGHVRHEIGHWLWAAKVEPDPWLVGEFRRLFGDERTDYRSALDAHYEQIDDGAWRASWVSRYAAAHPWEDFAESTAHVLHIDDVLSTAAAGHLMVGGLADFQARYAAWTQLVVELNEVARAMGEPDFYPFAPPPAAVEKMRFVEHVLTSFGTTKGAPGVPVG